MSAKEHWKPEPDEHDYPAAASYLSLLLPAPAVDALVAELRAAPIGHWKAKDLLRASGLALLPMDNPHVSSDLRKVKEGEKLSPVLLVRGSIERSASLQVADRLPPHLRQLSPRRERRHPLPDGRGPDGLII